MKFLALTPAAAYALLGGVALVIVLLHLLRPPPPRVVVPSVLLWVRLRRDRKRPASRRLIALLLALAVGLSIALALTRPQVPAIGATIQRLTLVLDNSPSMAARTRDGRSRWQHALERARALLEHASAASEVMVTDTVGRLGAPNFVDRDSALALLARISLPEWGNPHLPPMVAMAGAQVHLFTDGVAPMELPEGAIVHSVFEPADNVAVTAFEARAQARDPTRYEALVQLLNASPDAQRVRLLITGGNHFSIAQDLDLRAGETVNASFDISDFEGGVLGAAAVCQTDAFALDDVAYAVIPPHARKRVLLVTAGNAPLADALSSVPGVRLTVIAPNDYYGTAQHDVVVFDRFAPTTAPAAGALLLRPPARAWLAGQPTVLAGPRITVWNESHAVSGGIAWRNLRLTQAAVDAVTQSGPDALVLARGSTSGALVQAGLAHARWVKVGFALQDSNFALQPDFPVFLGNALSWVTQSVPVLTRGLGDIEVALREAQVRDGSGKPVAVSATAQGVVFEAYHPDVYTVSAAGGQTLVVANLPDPRYASINRTRLSESETAAAEHYLPPRAWNAELWWLLLLFAGALLLVEWAVFTRRLVS